MPPVVIFPLYTSLTPLQHKSMMFKRGLETLDKEYWDDSNDIVDA